MLTKVWQYVCISSCVLLVKGLVSGRKQAEDAIQAIRAWNRFLLIKLLELNLNLALSTIIVF